MKFFTTISTGNVMDESYTEYAAKFMSEAHTERGIVRAAEKALEARYGKSFKGMVTADDVAARVNGELVYVTTYQKQGLFK